MDRDEDTWQRTAARTHRSRQTPAQTVVDAYEELKQVREAVGREERLERLLEAVRLCARLKCLRPLTVMDNHQLEALRRVRELEMELRR